MRILVVLLLALLLSLFYSTRGDADILNSYSYQYLYFLNLYRHPMSLVKNYLKKFLNLGTKSKTMSQIQLVTDEYITSI
jgi:hypothetical protein